MTELLSLAIGIGLAVSLLFSFRDSGHEARLASALRQALPDVPVAASHEVLPVFREYERTSTVTAEAYLRPLVSGYLERMGTIAQSVLVLPILQNVAARIPIREGIKVRWRRKQEISLASS